MLKNQKSKIIYIQQITDFLFSFAVWLVVYYLYSRNVDGFQPDMEGLYVKTGVFLSLLNMYFFSKEGLYLNLRLNPILLEIQKTVVAHFYSMISFVISIYFVSSFKVSRSVILLYFIFGTVSFILVRCFFRVLSRKMNSFMADQKNCLLIGNGSSIEGFVKNIQAYPESGVRFCGWIDSMGSAAKLGVVDIEKDIKDVMSDRRIDAVVIGYSGKENYKTAEVISSIHNDVVPLVVLPDMTYSFVGHTLELIAGTPALVINQPDFSCMKLFIKRCIDVLVSGVGIVLISPLLMILAIGVKLSSAGPIFFGQERVGIDGTTFKMWKFRSMRVDAEAVSTWTTKNDPRKTKFGSFIRATSLDELPQLWNVLVGDMSLVGPRPEQPRYVDKFRHEIPAYMLRHKMKAGITGWAQVNGWRGDTSLHKRIECDLYYIRHWSIWLDIKILFLTFWKGFINKNAY